MDNFLLFMKEFVPEFLIQPLSQVKGTAGQGNFFCPGTKGQRDKKTFLSQDKGTMSWDILGHPLKLKNAWSLQKINATSRPLETLQSHFHNVSEPHFSTVPSIGPNLFQIRIDKTAPFCSVLSVLCAKKKTKECVLLKKYIKRRSNHSVKFLQKCVFWSGHEAGWTFQGVFMEKFFYFLFVLFTVYCSDQI